MKLFLVVGAAALVHAQADSGGYFPGEPQCALPCLASAITAAGCELSDIACQCGPTQSVIADKVGGCILSSCTNPTDLGAAISAGQAVCSSFLAGELSLTTPPGPPPTSTPAIASSSEPGTPNTGAILTSPPTPTPTTWSNETSIRTGSGSVTTTLKGTHTDTLVGSSTEVLTGSHTTVQTSVPTAAAATSTWLGAGMLAGMMGVVVLL